MTKPLPDLKDDEAAETFVATSDLTEYDLSNLVQTRFERTFQEAGDLQLPDHLLKAVRERAQREGIPVQRYIRRAIEHALQTGE